MARLHLKAIRCFCSKEVDALFFSTYKQQIYGTRIKTINDPNNTCLNVYFKFYW